MVYYHSNSPLPEQRVLPLTALVPEPGELPGLFVATACDYYGIRSSFCNPNLTGVIRSHRRV